MTKYITRFITALLLISSAAQAEFLNINSARTQQLMEEGVAVIDIRRAEEWQETGVLKNSKLLTFFDKQGRYDAVKWLEMLEESVDTSQPMILICHSGGRTGLVGKWLGKQFDTVYHVEDGIVEWLAEKRPTVEP